MGFTPIQESEIASPSVSYSGFTPISADEIVQPAPTVAAPEPSTYDYVMGGLKGIAKAGSDVVTAPADLAFRGGMYLADKVAGTDTNLKGSYPSDYRDRFLEFMSGGDGNKTAENVAQVGGNLVTVIANPSQAKNIASKIPLLSKAAESSTLANLLTKAIGYGTEGAGYGALFNAKSDTLGEDMTTGAALNIAVPAALKVTGDLAKGLSKSFSEAGRKLELSAFGAGKGKIKQAISRMPDILDDAGNFQNPINDALDSFQKAGGTKAGMSGEKLLSELDNQYQGLVGNLRQELEVAQGFQKEVIIPKFTKTEEYVSKLAGTSKGDAQRIALDEIAKTVNNTDGTLLSLQSEKVKLGQAIRDSAWGTDAAGQMKTNILKRIRADLRQEIESSYGALTGRSSEKVTQLNKELGKRESLFPLFKDMIASDESRTVLGSGLQSLRTSGGVGQTLIAAGAGLGAGGLPLGAAAVGANMFLQSPAGKKALANGLRSSLVNVPLQGVGKVSDLGQVLGRIGIGLSQQEDPASSASLSSDSQRALPLASTATQKANLEGSGIPSQNPISNQTPNLEASLKKVVGEDMYKKQAVSKIDEGAFVQKVDEIASDLGASPEHLLAVMNFETGGTFSPTEKNKAGSGATGLIQFMPATAKEITGEQTKEAAIKALSKMSATEQLDYVKKYLEPFKGKLNSLEDVYMAVLWPKAVGKDSEYALFKEGTKAYWQNRGLDINEDGIITKAEASKKVEAFSV
jgi:hypothetical protein